MSTIDEKLKEIEALVCVERPYWSEDLLEKCPKSYDQLTRLIVECATLIAIIKRCREQRDGYFPGQHHGLGYSLEEDDAELLALAEK